MNTFIQVAEIWVPDRDGSLLEFGSGLYANAPDFGGVSRSMCFGRGEGLPGRAWDERAPIVLKDLQSGYFQRARAARTARLTCAIAFPVYVGDSLKAVVALFCGGGPGASGAVELWCDEPREGGDMTWLDGVRGDDGAVDEAPCSAMRSVHGARLAGLARQRRRSVFMDSITVPMGATAGSPPRGLAIPCAVPGAKNYVLTFLSSPEAPIARRVESWVAGADTHGLRRAAGFDVVDGSLACEERSAGDVDAAISAAFAGAVPIATPECALLALPITDGETVVDTVAMYF